MSTTTPQNDDRGRRRRATSYELQIPRNEQVASMLIAMVIAVRQALDYESTLRAVGVCLIGWIAQAFLLGIVFSMVGGAPT